MKETSELDTNPSSKEIDISYLINVLWTKKITILFITSLFAIFSVFYALSLPNVYQSKVLFNVIQDEQSGIDSLASQYGGLASMAGIDIPQSSSKDKGALVIQTIQSREFMKYLITFDGVLEGIIAAKNFDIESQELIYDKDSFDSVTKEWIRDAKYPYKKIPSYLEAHEIFMKNIIVVDQDRRSGFINVSIEHISPLFAYKLLNRIVIEVNKIIKEHDMKESTMAIDYLNEQVNLSTSNNLRNSINRLYESQLRKKMMSNIRDEYIINVIDAPYIPEKKTGPTRSIICILITFIGGILSIFYVLIDAFFIKKKK